MPSQDNSKTEAALLLTTIKCPCGAKNALMKPMQSIDGDEMGVICLKCERFALGDDLKESVNNWNKLRLGY